ncbi:C39 family peptidase [Bacillus litorisediminis]|uniref:C39 family peptidase n=1 Tax=Bacillus litorisediminis TaxID=2922713 RepID=UPI001FAE9210|nr:C39 family peptidase [Bacillus litorisediminis]
MYNLVLTLGFLYFVDNKLNISQKIMPKLELSLSVLSNKEKNTSNQVFTSYLTTDPLMESVVPMQDPVIPIKDKVLLDVPILRQYPELPRGCEVTSLAMLLQDANVNVGKMQLAEEVKKHPTPYEKKNGEVYWGDPNNGFLGDMYSFDSPGYGVYYKPIQILANEYSPDRIIDLTGKNFTDLQVYLSKGVPIWVITNTTYKKLPESSFQTIHTESGEIKITYKEHSVLVTGYDQNHVYINDPITGEKNKKVEMEDFIEAWKQMGSQAITYLQEVV